MTPEGKGKSPYAKYGKVAHRYSPSLLAWRKAVKAGGAGATALALDWARIYAPWTLEPVTQPARSQRKLRRAA